MDAHNRFETPTTHALARAEWLAGLVVAVVLAFRHLHEINWWVFIAFFAVIDIIGYLPGAIAYRRSATGDISRGYHVAYNTMHSLLTCGALAGAWCLVEGPEWALLAVPIHLFGDRALFGNTMKPFGVRFEPATHPAFRTFLASYGGSTTQVPDRALKPAGKP